MVRLAVFVSLLVGCDVVFRIDVVPPPPDAFEPTRCTRYPFDGTTFDPAWATFVNDPRITLVQDDAIIIDFSGVAGIAIGAEAGARLGGAYDMRGATFDVEVPQVVTGSSGNVENYLRIRHHNDNGNGFVIRASNGTIGFWTRINNVYERHRDRGYDLLTDRYWRIWNGPDLAQVTFATRGLSSEPWMIQVQVPAAASFENVDILLNGGIYGSGDPAPGMAIYDNAALCDATPVM